MLVSHYPEDHHEETNQMLIITGNARLTKTPELRATKTGKAVLNIPVASDRRDRTADPLYLDLILWETHAETAARHLVKGQAITFTGRPETRTYTTSGGEQRTALEVHNVDIEYGPKPRASADTAPEPASSGEEVSADIPF